MRTLIPFPCLWIPLVAMTACYPPDKKTDSLDSGRIDDTGDPIEPGDALLRLGTPEGVSSGDISLTVTAVHPHSVSATLALTHSVDAGDFVASNVQDAPIHVDSAPDPGLDTVFVWRSLEDLGYGDFSVVFQAEVVDGGALWTSARTDAFTVSNVEPNEPPTIDVLDPTATLPSGAVDGPVEIPFVLDDPDDDPMSVFVEFDAGAGWLPATSADGSEPLAGLRAGEHAFVWDSLVDVGSVDADGVRVRMTPNDGTADGASDVTSRFRVENDPTPDLGEIVISEVMIRAVTFTPFIELRNLTRHPLDMSGLTLSNRARDLPLSSAGLIGGRAEAVFPTNGKVMAALGLGYAQEIADLTLMRFFGTIRLWGPLGNMSVIEYAANTWPYADGVSMQLGPGVVAGAEADPSNWCASSHEISGGGDRGTPGWANDLCSGYHSWTGQEFFGLGFSRTPTDIDHLDFNICHVGYDASGVPSVIPCPDCEFAFDVDFVYNTSVSEDPYGYCASDGYERSWGLILDYEIPDYGAYDVIAYYFSGYGWYPLSVAEWDGSLLQYHAFTMYNYEYGAYYYTGMISGEALIE
jgi:hypothetical protein